MAGRITCLMVCQLIMTNEVVQSPMCITVCMMSADSRICMEDHGIMLFFFIGKDIDSMIKLGNMATIESKCECYPT